MNAHKALLLVAALGLGAATAAAQREDPLALGAPPTEGAHLLELGLGLERPPPSAGASFTDPPLPPPPPAPVSSEGGRARLAAATSRTPASLALSIHGGLGPRLRSALASDLAYVSALRLGDGGAFVVSGTAESRGGRVSARLALGRRDRGGDLVRTYDGPEAGLLAFVHTFADDTVEALTGRRSAFVSRIVFGRRVARGRKDILVAHADGQNAERVSSGHGIATLPAFGPGDAVFYSVMTPTGVFITRSGTQDHPIIGGRRTNMGARFCGGRLYFASSRDGNTDLYSVAPDGTDERRLTAHAAIDVSPTCAPDGGIAFVSNRRGKPQIFLARSNDFGEPQQLTSGDVERQTPTLCGPWLAYTEVGDTMRVMLLDRRTDETRAVSPADGGEHKDPAFSPDCRMLAWASPRGIMVARRDGRLRRLLISGPAEAVRWSR